MSLSRDNIRERIARGIYSSDADTVLAMIENVVIVARQLPAQERLLIAEALLDASYDVQRM
jgi:hypothetical protein